jgi:eukaryotic-like serine/threonine-protein kinase
MLIGKRINDRYKILELIGGGGMSHVYLAEDMILNREVAIKVLRYDFTNEAELHRRFQREALAATTLDHPNIVSIYDVGDDSDYHFIVMEYIQGKTLKQYIQQFSPISPAKAVIIMRQLTSAIAHAHEHQIIHRDIKPQNILMDEQGTVKITDFGIATTLSATSYTKTNSVIGTVHYLSPEQAKGGISSHKSDIYALGIVLYELLTGELPFSGESAVSIALKHLQSETPSVRAVNSSIPQSLENVVIRATAKDPRHRYNSVEEMGADLQTALSITRMNEPKYEVPMEDGKTKVLPIIKEPPAPIIQPKVEPVQPVVNKEQPKKVSKKPFIIGGIIAVLIIGFALFMFLNPSKIEVPNLENYTLEEAQKEIESLGFVVGEITERTHIDIEKGRVIATNPKAEIKKIKGTKIDLVVSLGVEASEMEDFVGKQIDQVQSVLRGFKDIDIVDVFDDKPVGQIIEQTPVAGSEVIPEETTIVFKVSKGKKMVQVSDLKNYTQAAIKDYERSSGFIVKIASEEQYSDEVPAGSVISQTPEEGTNLEEGSTIEVVLSKGPEEKKAQVYNFDVLIEYEPTEVGVEQKIRIYIEDRTHSLVDLYREFTITSDEIFSFSLEIVEGKKGAYQIIRDNSVYKQETIPYDRSTD